MAQVKGAGEKDVEDIRTLVEEVEQRLAEARKGTYEFKRDVILGTQGGHSGATCAHKVMR